jgi:predicted nucleic-acid-binding protein
LKAIDSNIALRVITNDDPVQTPIAVALIASEPVFVSLTVAMEIEWVLRSAYRWTTDAIANALTAFAALDNVHVEEAGWLGWAIHRLRDGADFDDMIHLIAARDFDGFISFERKLKTQAGPDSPVPIDRLS